MRKLVYFLLDLRRHFKFRSSFTAFSGAYRTSDEAKLDIKSSLVGYDNAETVNRYSSKFNPSDMKISETEYPLFCWLSHILASSEKINIFDFGANLGIHYFKFVQFCEYTSLKWLVCEVPAIAQAGNDNFANSQLKFIATFDDIEGKTVMSSSGVLQYVESLNLSLSISTTTKAQIYLN